MLVAVINQDGHKLHHKCEPEAEILWLFFGKQQLGYKEGLSRLQPANCRLALANSGPHHALILRS